MEDLQGFYELLKNKEFKFEYVKELAGEMVSEEGPIKHISSKERRLMNIGTINEGEIVNSVAHGTYYELKGRKIGYTLLVAKNKYLNCIFSSNGIEENTSIAIKDNELDVILLKLSTDKLPGQGSAILYKFFTENKNKDREVIIVSAIQISIGFYQKVLKLFKEKGVILDYSMVNIGNTKDKNIIIQLPPLNLNKKEEPVLKNEITITSKKLKEILKNPKELEELKISEELKKLIKENRELILNSEAIKSGEIHLFTEKGDPALYFEEVEEE